MRQGDVVWYRFGGAGSEPAGRRPAVVVQSDRFHASRLATTVVAAITSNLRLAASPGNVRLRRGEARLPKPSVVNVTALYTVDRAALGTPLGTLPRARVEEILRGVLLVLGADELVETD